VNIKPIKSQRDYRSVMQEIETLRLEILVTLAEAWEARHFPIEAPDSIEAIRFAMEQRGWTRKDVEPLIGSRSRVGEILSGTRTLTLPMIRRLHQELGIPAHVLIQEPRRDIRRKPAA
jgi:HTH-type transcriptional regulator / antitoxin HigA